VTLASRSHNVCAIVVTAFECGSVTVQRVKIYTVCWIHSFVWRNNVFNTFLKIRVTVGDLEWNATMIVNKFAKKSKKMKLKCIIFTKNVLYQLDCKEMRWYSIIAQSLSWNIRLSRNTVWMLFVHFDFLFNIRLHVATALSPTITCYWTCYTA
jgi:hypothetical protein